jgi:hypothetical protein
MANIAPYRDSTVTGFVKLNVFSRFWIFFTARGEKLSDGGFGSTNRSGRYGILKSIIKRS